MSRLPSTTRYKDLAAQTIDVLRMLSPIIVGRAAGYMRPPPALGPLPCGRPTTSQPELGARLKPPRRGVSSAPFTTARPHPAARLVHLRLRQAAQEPAEVARLLRCELLRAEWRRLPRRRDRRRRRPLSLRQREHPPVVGHFGDRTGGRSHDGRRALGGEQGSHGAVGGLAGSGAGVQS